jgi:DNA polymerase-1
MLKMTWFNYSIKTKEDVLIFIKLYHRHRPKYPAFDTETNGLNIKRHTPFLIVFGFASTKEQVGYTFALDLELNPDIVPSMLYAVEKLFQRAEKVLAWNAKYDMHMLENIGYTGLFDKNITDVPIYARLAHDSLAKNKGGVSLALKDYATRFIDPNAKAYEKRLTKERTKIKKKRNRKLVQDLMREPIPLEFRRVMKNSKPQRWTLKIIDEILGDKVVGLTEMTPRVQRIIAEWDRTNPSEDNYQNLPREVLTKYAHYDVIFTIEAFMLVQPVAIARGQETTIKLEEELIMPLYRMENVGFAFNREYTLESKERLRSYILKKRKELCDIAGLKLKVNQHPTIKSILNGRFHLGIASTGADVLNKLKVENKEAQHFIDLVSELRTLEKWYSTYIIKWLNGEVDGRIYTQVNQAGTVSGRVSSDFQQFPQKPIYDDENNLLFHPRKMIKVSGGNYNKIFYLDYSQIELRFQALYTIYVSGGDTNLCRAYMPLHCHRGTEKYDFNNTEHIAQWNSGDWYLDEAPDTLWTKTDLHGVMAMNAFPHTDPSQKDWKMYRKIGKTTNFACNYGATTGGLQRELGHTPELANHLYKMYLKTFPELKAYREYVTSMLGQQGFIEDLFGRKFYGMSAHEGANRLVQGSAADFLKMKMIKADAYLVKNNLKTRFQMNIHDEMSFELHDGEELVIAELTALMEGLPGTKVPIVADAEITSTTWDEKADL